MGLLDFFRAGKIRQENEALKLQNNFLIQKNAFLDKKLHDLGCETYEQVQQKCVEVQKQIGQHEIELDNLAKRYETANADLAETTNSPKRKSNSRVQISACAKARNFTKP